MPPALEGRVAAGLMEPLAINPEEASYAEVFEVLDKGMTVVTGNIRLAGVVGQKFEQEWINRGKEVWPTPDVLPWTAWMQRTWEEAMVSGSAPVPHILLSPPQEQRIWEDIINQEASWTQGAGSVHRVQEAWRLMQSWRLPTDPAAFRYNRDSAAFWEWKGRFESRCAARGWLSAARLADEILSALQSGQWTGPDELVLIGFDELVPQQQGLLQGLSGLGCTVRWWQLAERGGRTAGTRCLDARREAAVMAQWVRQHLERTPRAAIGVVVPDLASKRDLITHALDEALVPHVMEPGHQSGVRPYNLSLGLPLSTCPVIGTALKLLGLLAPTIPLKEMGRLICSPFMEGWEPESRARALLDGRLREAGELEVSLRTLRYHASQCGKPYYCPVLVANLDAWRVAARELPGTDTPGQWSERFSGLLKTVGWARGRTLSSAEYQATEAWQDLLGTFASLGLVTGPMGAGAAVGQLQRLAENRMFQPKTGLVPVQVLGMLEAAWLQFDCLWVMGLHDGIWPVPPRPNPFIPLPLQRKAGLPHSSEERELQVSRTITRRLLASASEVIASSPQRDGDEELRPSPLISDLGVVDPQALGLWPASTWQDAIYDSARLTTLWEDPAPPLETEAVSGGSRVFRLQSACPFRAFAELRLGAQPLGYADIGLNGLARGALVHRTLEKVWHVLKSHQALVTMGRAETEMLVEAMADEAVDEISTRYPQTFSTEFRELEVRRLCRHVLEWLQLEEARLDPFEVAEKEKKYEARAGGVRVRLYIDRIDQLDDGRRIVMDYKTSKASPAQWFGERPDEPQLPLYSMAVDGELAGVLFAQVKAGDMAFKGALEEDELVPGLMSYKKSLRQVCQAPSWQDLLQDWKSTIEGLGKAFRKGEAAVDPKRYPATCTYCHLTPLCRIKELNVRGGQPPGAEDTS